MVQVAAAVEHDSLDPGLLGGVGDCLADRACLLDPVALERLREAELTRAGECAAILVVDQLGEDAAVRPVDGQPGPLRRAADLAADPVPALLVHGTRDASAPIEVTGRPTAALIPGARLDVCEGAPHGLFVTHRDRLTADLRAFAGA